MAHVHLPARHGDDDLALAAALARLLRSEDLYVAWARGTGPAPPEIPAQVKAAGRPGSRRGRLARRRRRPD